MKKQLHHPAPLLPALLFTFICKPPSVDNSAEFEGLIRPYDLINIGIPVENPISGIIVESCVSL